VKGEIKPDEPTLIRVHVISALQDMIGERDPGHWSINAALAKIADAGKGVLVILNPYEEGQELAREVRQYKMKQVGLPSPEAGGENPELRRYGIGAQILNDIGVGLMRIMGAPRRLHSLGGYGLELVDWVALDESADSGDGQGEADNQRDSDIQRDASKSNHEVSNARG
ncbi:MAG: hypothetical protein VW985_13505, partial [Gammaproteobacteria bacterium]